jgi:hypothetical protein
LATISEPNPVAWEEPESNLLAERGDDPRDDPNGEMDVASLQP